MTEVGHHVPASSPAGQLGLPHPPVTPAPLPPAVSITDLDPSVCWAHPTDSPREEPQIFGIIHSLKSLLLTPPPLARVQF